MLIKSQSEVRLHTGRSVHFHPIRNTRPSFSIFRGSGSETTLHLHTSYNSTGCAIYSTRERFRFHHGQNRKLHALPPPSQIKMTSLCALDLRIAPNSKVLFKPAALTSYEHLGMQLICSFNNDINVHLKDFLLLCWSCFTMHLFASVVTYQLRSNTGHQKTNVPYISTE